MGFPSMWGVDVDVNVRSIIAHAAPMKKPGLLSMTGLAMFL
jgi:hypothetical protein